MTQTHVSVTHKGRIIQEILIFNINAINVIVKDFSSILKMKIICYLVQIVYVPSILDFVDRWLIWHGFFYIILQVIM